MKDEMSFQQKGLFQQGYQEYSPSQLKQLEWGLRFTPFVCSAITAYGLFTAQPAVLFAVSLLGLWAFLAPAAHPMDLLYNHAVRHLACLAAGVMNFAAAMLFLLELPIAALSVGLMLLALQAIVITTHLCVLSWMYEGVMRALGKWHAPLALQEAAALLATGARLVDVRSPNEYAAGAVHGAINLPAEHIHQHVDTLGENCCLLYCQSGARSQLAVQTLRASGLTNVHDLGSKARAEALVQAN